MDTYGCNIVAQVYGRKTWIMFPPKYTSILKPTRVPYEESSIYSEINFQCGTSELPNMEDIYTTELEPGDVLIVPRHWWHYVENTTIAISINMWVPLPHDDNSRLEEALVRYFITSIVKHIPSDDYCNILNPNEIDLPSEVNDIQQINWCIKKCQESNHENVNLPNNTEKLPTEISVVSKISFDTFKENQLRRCNCDKQERKKKDCVSMHDVINAYCHPEVITKIKQVLLEQMEPN
uniref:JmjC domain-containing protein n=1 Tax=Clastoptera arizonana TaxID=38151 RepID=A0A1B6DI87_9HEMI